MKNIYFDDLLKKIPNKYLLTIVAGKRARNLMLNKEDMKNETQRKLIVNRVFREILDEKISIDLEEYKEII